MAMSSDRPLGEDDARRTRLAVEYCYEQGWTDGLPVVPAIPEFLDEFLAAAPARSPDEVLLASEELDRVCTVRHAAVNAVMAGCRPEYFPALLAALDALRSVGAALGRLPSAQLLIVFNGPVRHRLGLGPREGLLTNSVRASTTLARAMRLVLMNSLGLRPRSADEGVEDQAAGLCFCLAEDEEASPWPPQHVELGLAPEESAAFVRPVAGVLPCAPRGIRDPEALLDAVAAVIAAAGYGDRATTPNEGRGAVVVLPAERARTLAAGGWSRREVEERLARGLAYGAAATASVVRLVVAGASHVTVCPAAGPGGSATLRL